VPLDHPGDPVIWAGYRCRSAYCGWNEWLMWIIEAEDRE